MTDSMAFTAAYIGGGRIECQVRNHTIVTDQPTPTGEDAAPTPTEFFVASLVSCTCYYLMSGCKKYGIDTAGIKVTAEADKATNPTRIGAVRMTLHVPATVPEDKRERLLKIAEACLVHNSITHPPTIQQTLHV